ncbi:MAG TPA: calcium/sodium antiporter [Candidatus Nanoarchaeia archaeon]|nr:calcium/sodium antiporter [Candidatus Nanoarchaeia archaeon]
MLFDILLLLISIPILIYSSELFTENAAKLADSIGVSHFLIGITFVGIGTSLPEIMVTNYASLTNESGIALGNVIGSNITNIALILGVSFFIRRTVIPQGSIFKDSVVHLVVLVLGTFIFLSGNIISRFEGVVLSVVYVSYVLYSIQSHKIPEDKQVNHERFMKKRTIYIILGLVGVLIGSKLLVDSAVIIAGKLGISSAVIAITVVALGTSLPELVVSISAAKRGFIMLILGNIVGSNITNMMLAMGTASMIREVVVEEVSFIQFNLAYMLLLSIILIAAMKKKNLSRIWGVMYLLLYAVFIGFSCTGLINGL